MQFGHELFNASFYPPTLQQHEPLETCLLPMIVRQSFIAHTYSLYPNLIRRQIGGKKNGRKKKDNHVFLLRHKKEKRKQQKPGQTRIVTSSCVRGVFVTLF